MKMVAGTRLHQDMCHIKVERLQDAVDLLLSWLNRTASTRSGFKEAAQGIDRYQAILQAGLFADDILAVLRGASLLTTVNKGIGDLAATGSYPDIGRAAFEVTRNALDGSRFASR